MVRWFLLVGVLVLALGLVGGTSLVQAFPTPNDTDGHAHVPGIVTDPETCGTYVRGADGSGYQLDPASYLFTQPSPLGIVGAAAAIDFHWIHDVGDDFVVWDLGTPVSVVDVFPSIDHGPVPGEALEWTVWGSNDLTLPEASWAVGDITTIFDSGWNAGWIADDWVSRWAFSAPYRYVGVHWGGPKALVSDGDAEVDAVCAPALANPNIKKVPNLANLWLCNTGATTCTNKASGVEEVNFDVRLNSPVTSLEPKCTGFPNFQDPATCSPQTIGAFEFELRYDAKFVTVTVERGALFDRPEVTCASTPGEGFLQFRCVTKGKPDHTPSGPGVLAVVHVRPTADVRSILIPNQLNGIATQLINQDCQLADLQGHPIPIPQVRVVDQNGSASLDPCGDAAITIRYLEGDVHADCRVDVHDQQQIAFRWGSRLGQLLFNDRFDLEPSAPKKGDDDIDAKDLQLVYGRHGSTCKAPHPAQDPVDPKAKVEPPLDNAGG